MPGRYSRLSIFFVLVLVLGFTIRWRWIGDDGNAYKQCIASDGKGYYVYLPATFIYHDLTYAFIDANPKLFYLGYEKAFIVKDNGKKLNKYTVGVSLLLLPFFVLAWLFSVLLNFPLDGYSVLFQCAVSFGALFYLWLGLHCLRKLLLSLFFSDKTVAITLVAIGGATNLFYYTVMAPSMSHVYSFAAITAFAWYVRYFFNSERKRYWIKLVLTLTLIIMIRPLNGLVVMFIPLFAVSKDRFKNGMQMLMSDRKFVLYTFLIMLVGGLIQGLLWYKQTQTWMHWSYKNEGFNFLHPEFIQVLFGFRKGLFVYSPVLLLIFPALFLIYFQKKEKFWLFFIPLLVIIYFISAWWNWYYGDSFGHRAFIDWFCVFALLIAEAIQMIKVKWLKYFVFVFVLSSIGLNIFQSWQYKEGIIHPDCMDRQKYLGSLLKTNEQYKNAFSGINDAVYGALDDTPFVSFKNNFDSIPLNWSDVKTINENGSKYQQLDSINEYSSTLRILASAVYVNEPLYLKVKLKRKECVALNDSKGVFLVLSIDSAANKNYFWNGWPLNDLYQENPFEWKEFNFNLNFPKLYSENDQIIICIWNRDKKKVAVDDFEVEFYKIKR